MEQAISTQWRTQRDVDTDRSVITRIGSVSVPQRLRLWVVDQGKGFAICPAADSEPISKEFDTMQEAMDYAEIECCQMIAEVIRQAQGAAEKRIRERGADA